MGEAELDRLRHLYSAWNAGHRETLVAGFHPELEFRTSGSFPDLEPVYHGREGASRFWDAFQGMWESIAILVEHYVVSADVVAALWRFDGRGRDGVRVRRDGGHVARFRDGLISKLRAYGDWGETLHDVPDGERAAVMLRGWEVLNSPEADFAVAERLMHDDAVVVPLVGRLEGSDYRGPAGLMAYREDMRRDWDHVAWRPRVLRLSGDRAVCTVEISGGGRDGIEVHQTATVIVDFRGDRAARIEAQRAADEALSAADVAGVWRLAEWMSSRGSEVVHPAGRDARGQLIYHPSGAMSVHIAAADGHTGAFGYCGRWELDGAEVVHHVDIDARPERPGTAVRRLVELRGRDLVLTKPPEDGWVETIRWRRGAALPEPG